MKEEEKKAIEILRFSTLIRGRKPENDAVEILLNLIGKQSSVLNKIKQLTKIIICDEEGKLQKMVYADELYETFRELEVEINEFRHNILQQNELQE